MSRARISGWITLFVFAAAIVLVPVAHAGPPLICWPYDIGNAKTLPWGTGGWKAPRADYDVTKLTGDTLALLNATTPVIVRMETLRRATIYASQNAGVAEELLSALQARATAAEAKGHPDALASFDLGYLVESYKQMSYAPTARHLATPALDGYRHVEKAIALRGGDPEMELAAALMTIDGRGQSRADAHWQKAVAGAADESLLARNLVSHCQMFGLRATTIADLRAQVTQARK